MTIIGACCAPCSTSPFSTHAPQPHTDDATSSTSASPVAEAGAACGNSGKAVASASGTAVCSDSGPTVSRWNSYVAIAVAAASSTANGQPPTKKSQTTGGNSTAAVPSRCSRFFVAGVTGGQPTPAAGRAASATSPASARHLGQPRRPPGQHAALQLPRVEAPLA